MRKTQFFLLVCIVQLAVSIGFCAQALAQQDPHHTQYLFNGLAINPAYAGSRGTPSGMLFVRNQWTGFEGAPTTQTFNFHMPFNQQRSGFGLSLLNDKIGYTGQQWLTLSYAHILPIGEHAHLALGLRGGIMNYRINWNQVEILDANDPILMNNVRSLTMPNIGTGVYFSTDRMFAGLSVPHILNTPLLPSSGGQAAVARLYRHAYFTTGFVLGLKNQVQWKPSILVKYSPGAPMELDLNLMAYFAQRIWLGLSWRSNDAIAAMVDFQVAKMIHVGYAYDYSITRLGQFHNGSHEFVLGFELASKRSKMKSPRYF